MDKNRLFMQNLMTDEVPWHRITTAYGRATKFPEYFKSLYDMSDMLKEEYLWSEEYDEDEDEMRYREDEVFPDDLFYSFYYYSYQALLSCKPLLQQLENTDLDKEARKLQELLLKRHKKFY